jgi:hypothetical protein
MSGVRLRIFNAEEIQNVATFGSNDPYVRATLLPGGRSQSRGEHHPSGGKRKRRRRRREEGGGRREEVVEASGRRENLFLVSF